MIGKKGQMKEVLNHLKSKKSITSMQAFELYGCTRLAAKIHDLRKAGYDIRNVWMDTETRYGEPCRYVKYVYKGKSK